LGSCGSVSNPERAINNLESRPKISDAQISNISEVLSYFPDQTQLSIAIIDDSSTAYYGALRHHDTLKTIKNRSSVFEIGSMTKVFTSALLADLVIQKKVRLDDPIQDYLEFPLKDSLQITFRELANHSSGLPKVPSGFIWQSLWHMDNPYKNYDEKELLNYLQNEIELEAEPGTTFQYSNIGAGILGYVLTKVEDRSLEEMWQERLFKPLNMQNSTVYREEASDLLVRGLNKKGNPTANWDLGALKGAGAILSSAEDMTKFALANFDTSRKALVMQRKKTFRVDENTDIGLGWFIKKQYSPEKWFWHNGGTGGYRSSMVINVEDQKAVVILSNISAGHKHADKIDSLSFTLLQHIQ
jgi:CubicO group peptidase (beta-lactamase class C family)